MQLGLVHAGASHAARALLPARSPGAGSDGGSHEEEERIAAEWVRALEVEEAAAGPGGDADVAGWLAAAEAQDQQASNATQSMETAVTQPTQEPLR